MTNASSNSVRLQWAPEVAAGTPNGAATPQDLRFLTESIERSDSFRESAEITSDATAKAGIQLDESAAGQVSCELSCTTYDDWLRYVMRAGAFPGSSTITIVGSTVTFVAADNTLRDSANGLGGVATGSIIEVTVAGTAANKQIYIVDKAITAGKLFLAGNFVTDDAVAAPATIVVWQKVTNGTTITNFTLEREHRDLTTTFANFRYGTVRSARISNRAGDTCKVDFGLSFSKQTRATATVFAGSPTAQTSTPLIPSKDGILHIFEGGPCGQVLAISSTTDATPIVVTTSTTHGLETGDIVRIINVTTNVAANGCFSILKLTSTTFSLRNRTTLASVAGSGAGASGVAGTVTKIPSAVCFTGFDFEQQNNQAEQLQLGASCPKQFIATSLRTKGTLSYLMQEDRILRKIENKERSSLCVVYKDSAGNQMAWMWTDVEFQAESGSGSSGSDNAIIPTVTWNAVKGSVTGDLVQQSFHKP